MKSINEISSNDIVEYLELILTKEQFKKLNKIDKDLIGSHAVEETGRIMSEAMDLIKADSEISDAVKLIYFLHTKGYDIMEVVGKEII